MSSSIFSLSIPRAASRIGFSFFGGQFARPVEGPGPFRYDDTANWKGWLINNQITNSPGAEQTIVFTTDRTM